MTSLTWLDRVRVLNVWQKKVERSYVQKRVPGKSNTDESVVCVPDGFGELDGRLVVYVQAVC